MYKKTKIDICVIEFPFECSQTVIESGWKTCFCPILIKHSILLFLFVQTFEAINFKRTSK